MTQRFQVRFVRVPRWLIVLVAALALALALALIVLTLGVFLLILPVLIVTAVLYYLFGPSRRSSEAERDSGGRVIEGEYRVIEREQPERDRRDSS